MSQRQHKVTVLGVHLSPLTYHKVLGHITRFVKNNKRGYICVSAVHLVMECGKNEALRRGVNAASLVVPDGMPLVWLLRKNRQYTERIYGPDLMLKTCELAASRKWGVFLVGGSKGQSKIVRSKLQILFPTLRITGCFDTPSRPLTPAENQQIIQAIRASAPHIVFVGLGCPLQEFWMIQNRTALSANMLIGVGAAFDFISGKVKQAPPWIQHTGFEWLFRLVREPRRLWKRYLVYNVRFVFQILRDHFIH